MIKKRTLPRKYKSKRTYVRKFSSSSVYGRKRGKESFMPKLAKFLKRTFLRIFILGILVFIFILLFRAYNYAKTYLYDDERFFIDDIDVVGCGNVTETEIKKLIPFNVGDSMLKICLASTKAQLQEEKPELKNISLKRDWKEKKIIISLEERTPEVFILDGDNKIGLDFDNKPFPLRGNMFDMKIPVLTYSDEQEKKTLLNFFEQFKTYMTDFIPAITEIKFGETEDVILNMGDKTVCWGHIQYKKTEEKTDKLRFVLKDLTERNINAKYVDLSLMDNNKDRIIVKVVPDENAEQETK